MSIRSNLKQPRLSLPPEESTIPVQDETLDTDAYGNETRRLGGTKAAFHRPWHKDKRRWVRWPAQLWQVTGKRFIRQGRRSKFRPASHWWSRWPDYAWRKFQRFGLFDILLRPLLHSYLNVLLVLLPLTLVAAVTPLAPDTVLVFNFLAIIPLSGLVLLACEDLSANLNETMGKLLVALSDNLVELVFGIVALCQGEIHLVQLSVIGSVLCYSLLIMGSCFFIHGVRYKEGSFNKFSTNSITSLNVVAMCFFLIPSTLYASLEASTSTDLSLVLSHGIAIVLLILYALYVLFSIRTHNRVFDISEEGDISEEDEIDASADIADRSLGPIAASVWLAASLTCVTLCAVALVSSIQGSIWKVKRSFLGLVLLPFLGNVTDYLSASGVSTKNNLDITILVTMGSSLQLLLFTLPVLVILGWIIDEPLTLNIDLFGTASAFLGVFVVSYVVADGKSNYLCGAMCISLYAIIALAAFLITDDS